jgi:hypothetical protein
MFYPSLQILFWTFFSPLKLQRFSLNMLSDTVCLMKGIWPVNPQGQTLHSFFDIHVTVHRDKLLTIEPTRCTHFSNLFWNETLHVSDSSSVHHQEFFTVHTAMVYVIQVCWQLASRIRMELFGQFLCPSSGVFHCTHGNGICHTGLLTTCKQD